MREEGRLTAENSAVMFVGYEKSLVLSKATATDLSDSSFAYTKLVI